VTAPRLIPLAAVARPHGVQGELKLKLYNSDSDLLLSLKQVYLKLKNAEAAPATLTSARRANDSILIRVRGYDDRNQVEALRGAEILAPRDVFPPLEQGEFYVCDVVGARVVDPDGEVGIVDDIVSYPTCDALVIRTADGPLELPLVDGVVDEVDVAGGVVRVARRAGEE